MIAGTLLLLLAVTDTPPICQRETIVALFRATASGRGTIADLARLIADQGELEEGLLRCKLSPDSAGKSLTSNQEQMVKRALDHPADNRSECLAYLRYKWPGVFGREVGPNEIVGPVTEPDPTTLVYSVAIEGRTVRFRFEPNSCQVMTIQMADGGSAFGRVDCLWRRKTK